MDYKFLTECKQTQQNGFTEQQKRAYESIIDFLFRMKLYGKQKARQIDEYDGESLFGNTTLIPGQIYAFIYEAKSPTVYDNGQIKFSFTDKLPIVLVTHTKGDVVRGINMNLCSFALRTYIINALHNLDLEFYNRGNLVMANNGQAPYSQNVTKMFMSEDNEKRFVDHIVRECHLKNTQILYRNYNIHNIKVVRFIECWQHKYIPFLNYTGEVKQNVLDMIYKITGVENVRI